MQISVCSNQRQFPEQGGARGARRQAGRRPAILREGETEGGGGGGGGGLEGGREGGKQPGRGQAAREGRRDGGREGGREGGGDKGGKQTSRQIMRLEFEAIRAGPLVCLCSTQGRCT